MHIYLFCFVCTSVGTTATEWKLNCSSSNNNNNNNNKLEFALWQEEHRFWALLRILSNNVQGVKRPRLEADHSLQNCVQNMPAWGHITNSPNAFVAMW